MKLQKTTRGYRVDFYHPVSHIRIRQVLRARTLSEAKQMAEHFRLELLATAGVPVSSAARESPNICAAIEAYLNECSELKSRSSKVTDGQALRGFMETSGNERIDDLNQADISAYVRREFLDKSLKSSSVNRRLNSIKHFLGWCFRNGWIKYDLAKVVRHIKGPTRESRPLTDVELGAILSQADVDLRLQIQLAATLGLRAGEIASLEWASIDFSRGTIRVGASGNFQTKSGKAKTLYLTPELRSVLLNRAKVLPWVFANNLGNGPITSTLVTRAWIRARRRAGLSDMKFHDLRATAGARLADRGSGDAVIARILGHSSVQMARKYSNQINDEVLRRGLCGVEESLSEVFGQNTGRIFELKKTAVC